MDIHRQQALEKVQNWFSKASNWQKDLFCIIWAGSTKEDQILDRAKKLAAQEYLGVSYRFTPETTFPVELTFSDSSRPPVILKAISNVIGVGALASDAPLEFTNGLTVVYGENGCGKSSYVRILKALENPVNAENVLGNVFDEHPTPAKAEIIFSVDGIDDPITWTKSCTTKYPIQIYDTTAARQFVDKENEVVYEPKALSVITQMASIYEQVSSFYASEIQEIQKRFLPPQQEIYCHPIVNEFEGLSTIEGVEKFARKYVWEESSKIELNVIIESLKENDPLQAATALEAKKAIVCSHSRIIIELLNLVNDAACESYLIKRTQQIETRKTQESLITASKQQSVLENFGSDPWRALWMQANMYINSIESIEGGIPVSQSGRCALCQQEIDASAKSRMQSFKKFYESNTITEAENAYQEFCTAVSLLQTKIENKVNPNTITESMEASTIPAEIQDTILKFYSKILIRCKWLLAYVEGNPTDLPNIETEEIVKEEFKNIIAIWDAQIKAFKDASANQEKQIARKDELTAISWAVSVIPAKTDILRIRNIVSNCKTNALTTLKKELSRLLITDEYVSKFQAEMALFDERGHIKVELVEASSKRGKSYHQISLREAKSAGNHKNGEVLSEGEFRVVSLAAFLADLSAWGRVMPFIFDDPITSLDQKYEARVATRLVQLSLERQVIVFTHRLAFAQLLNSETVNFNIVADKDRRSERATICNVQLRKLPLGYPEPPAYMKDVSLSKAIKHLRGNEVPEIKRKQKEGDFAMADCMIKSLCSDFRKIVEQGIAQDLLSGIVSRYSREVSSLKLARLYAITPEDITLFHNMMSKYSCYEHSQPVEAPISLPDISEIEEDLNYMEDWAKKFEKRCQAEAEKMRGMV